MLTTFHLQGSFAPCRWDSTPDSRYKFVLRARHVSPAYGPSRASAARKQFVRTPLKEVINSYVCADACVGVRCRNGARCDRGRCVCPSDCPDNDPTTTVCGSDGKTYTSACTLRRDACIRGVELTVVDDGACEDDGSGSGGSSSNSLHILSFWCNSSSVMFCIFLISLCITIYFVFSLSVFLDLSVCYWWLALMGFSLYWQPAIVKSVHSQINFVRSFVRLCQ